MKNDELLKTIKQLKIELINLESDHNLLIDTKEQQYNELTKQIKHESEARKRLVKELVLYKKALELSCIFMEEKCDWDDNLLPIYTEKKRIFEYFLQQAKEEIENGNKN